MFCPAFIPDNIPLSISAASGIISTSPNSSLWMSADHLQKVVSSLSGILSYLHVHVSA